jgi:hypothetical protein
LDRVRRLAFDSAAVGTRAFTVSGPIQVGAWLRIMVTPTNGVPVTLDAGRGRSLPPTVMHGARGWLSGYVVPVLSGTIRGALQIDGHKLPLDHLTGYHDHNWGFWQGVRWQWGQVAHDDLSFVYGRVFPPSGVADPERIPGFLGILGPDGPIGVSTDVSIVERDANGSPQQVEITARDPGTAGTNIRLVMTVDRAVRSDFALTSSALRRRRSAQPAGGPRHGLHGRSPD